MNLVERVLSNLFPPRLEGSVDSDTFEYQYRTSRRGVDNVPGSAVGRLAGPAKEKRVILLGPRTVWE
jgi:hypothetical protein